MICYIYLFELEDKNRISVWSIGRWTNINLNSNVNIILGAKNAKEKSIYESIFAKSHVCTS